MDVFPGRRLVIFGCGYVGQEVARRAVARGCHVTALTRNARQARDLEAMGVAVVLADLASADWHPKIPGAPDYALNCVSSGGGGLESYRRSYVDGMRSLLQWAETVGKIGTLVYTSSTSVYPQGDGATVDESARHDGLGERGALLLEAERLLGAAAGQPRSTAGRAAVTGSISATNARAACERFFILRLAGIYGPGRQHLLDQVRTGIVAGRGERRLNLIHRDDICSAIFAAFKAPPECHNEVFNVADDDPSPKAEVAAWLAHQLGIPPPEFSGLPVGGRSAVTPDRVIANGKLKRVLGWRPGYPSFREGYENILSCGAE